MKLERSTAPLKLFLNFKVVLRVIYIKYTLTPN